MGTVNQEEQLTRIADALESISCSLEGINSSLVDVAVSLDSLDNAMTSCISTYGNNHFLCITGNVSTQ